jgi:ubiquinone biosynthesis protein COQ9
MMATKRILTRSIAKRNTPLLSSRRPYHSYDHPPPPSQFNEVESSILSAAALHIPTHGFTNTTLALGAKDVGYIDASVNLFPKGAFTLVHWYLVRERLALAGRLQRIEELQKNDGRKVGVGGKVNVLTWERLMANKEIIHRWQEVCVPGLVTL